jgi:hypothetical protein
MMKDILPIGSVVQFKKWGSKIDDN